MTTQLWLRGDATSQGSPGVIRGTNLADLTGTTRGWYPHLLTGTRGATASGGVVNSVTGPTAGLDSITSISGFSGCGDEFVSMPVDQDFTLSGTITLNLWGFEQTMTDNGAINAVIERIDSTGAVVSQIAKTARVTELSTSGTANNFTVTPTSTSMKEGDRIRVRIFFDDAGTMATGGSFTSNYGGPTAAASGDSYVTFTETFGFLTTEPTGSILYLTSVAGPAVGANNEREMWTSRGASATTAVRNTAAGWTAPLQWTDSAGGTAIEWYSKPLTAFTLDGLVRLNLRAAESNAAANVALCAEIAICNGDGSSAVVWGSATILDSATPGANASSTMGELVVTTETVVRGWLSGDATAVTDGQRLRLRVFIDDIVRDPMAASQTATLWYDGPTAAASGDSWIQLPQSVTEAANGSTGTLAKTLDNATLAASGTTTITGTVAKTLAGATVAASGWAGTIDGTLARTLAGITSAAQGTTTVVGTLARTLAGATLAAAGTQLIGGTLAKTLDGATVAASGTTTVVGTTARTLAGATSSAAGTTTVLGTVSANLVGVAAAAQGTTTILGTAATTLAGVTSAATGTTTVVGTVAKTLDNVTLAASGDVGGTISGTLAKTLDNATLAASGTTTVVGTVARTLDGVTSAAQGTTTVVGTLARTLANVTSAAAGTTTIPGSIAATLGNVTSSASGTTTVIGTVAKALDNAILSASGVHGSATGTLAETLDGVVSTASGTTTVLGTVARTLGGATLAAVGTTTVIATVARTLDGATLAANGSHGAAPVGTLARTLDGATSSAAGTTTITGSVARTLAGVAPSAAGTTTVTGSVSQTLMGAALSAQGTTTVKGTATATLQGVVSTSSGTTIILGSLSRSLAGVTLSAFGFPGVLFHPTLSFGNAFRTHPFRDAERAVMFASATRRNVFGESVVVRITTLTPETNLRYALEAVAT